MSGAATAAFDNASPTYDADFTETALGRTLRGRVWEILCDRFHAGSRVLELNCGTGEDACFLARKGVLVTATDGSRGMLARAGEKVRGGGLETLVSIRRLELAEPDADFEAEGFDGAFSNFGGLNCVAELGPLAASLGHWLRPGAVLLLVVMSPLCLWEILTSLLRLDFRMAFRRLSRGGATARIGGEEIPVVYPWPAELARTFAPFFVLERIEALGVVLPPSLWSAAMEERPTLLRSLGSMERLVRTLWPFRYLGDHTILELRRRP